MIEESMKYAKQIPLQNYKAPSRKRLSGDLLASDQAYKSIKKLVAPILAVAKQNGARQPAAPLNTAEYSDPVNLSKSAARVFSHLQGTRLFRIAKEGSRTRPSWRRADAELPRVASRSIKNRT